MYEDKERESNTYYKRKVLRKTEEQREKKKQTIKMKMNINNDLTGL